MPGGTRVAGGGGASRPAHRGQRGVEQDGAIPSLLGTAVGKEFDAGEWEEDLRRLRNSGLFYLVQGEVVPEGEGVILEAGCAWRREPLRQCGLSFGLQQFLRGAAPGTFATLKTYGLIMVIELMHNPG